MTRRLLVYHRPKKLDDMETAEVASPCKTRSSLDVSDSKNSCLFCDVGARTEKLVCVATLEIGPNIYAHAKELNDRKLLAKLTNTDLVAKEAKYHKSCYRQFLNRYRSYKGSKNAESSVHRAKKLTYGLVVGELVQYMQDMYLYSKIAPIFHLSDL